MDRCHHDSRSGPRPGQSLWAAPSSLDRTMMLLAVQTGLRVSELIGLNCADMTLGDGANVRCEGKGRKHRTVPLTGPVINLIRLWLTERAGRPGDPLFCTRTGRRLSRDAVALRVRTHAETATERCPSLAGKRIHPHVLRHSCAMTLLQAGVDLRHRPVARTRWRQINRSVPACRHHDQGTSARPHHPRQRQARPLPAGRQDARVPREPVTMPTTQTRDGVAANQPRPPPRHSRRVGIDRPMQISA